MSPRRHRALAQVCIDRLEPRRMLATFFGTSGPDVVTIATEAGAQQTAVTINGTRQVTTDQSISVQTLEGDDVVQFPVLIDTFSFSARSITVNLGPGNDFAVNSSAGTLNDIDYGLAITGDAESTRSPSTTEMEHDTGSIVSNDRSRSRANSPSQMEQALGRQ